MWKSLSLAFYNNKDVHVVMTWKTKNSEDIDIDWEYWLLVKFSSEPEANKVCEWLKVFVDLNVTQEVQCAVFLQGDKFCFIEIQQSHPHLDWGDATFLNTHCNLTTSIVFTDPS